MTISNDRRLIAPRFTLVDAIRAGEEWGANCGPAAIAMVAGLTLEEVRPHLGDFERKGYTNPTLMLECLNRLGVKYKSRRSLVTMGDGYPTWPTFGLVRVQWEGPWTAPGVPIPVRYRHTHWVGSMIVDDEEQNVFDVNCMSVGGWVPLSQWSASVVPWLLNICEPKASGGWHLTHVIEIDAPASASKKQHDTPAIAQS